MPRPKGSKNKAKENITSATDYVALIAEKNAAAEAVANEIEALGTNILLTC